MQREREVQQRGSEKPRLPYEFNKLVAKKTAKSEPEHHEAHESVVMLDSMQTQRVIEQTARFAAAHGARAEAALRERERNNPTFAFLDESNALHAYYRDLRDGRTAHRVQFATAAAPESETVQIIERFVRVNEESNGEFERSIYEKKQLDIASFSFLLRNNPNHAFYLMCKEKRAPNASDADSNAVSEQSEPAERASVERTREEQERIALLRERVKQLREKKNADMPAKRQRSVE